MFELRVRKAQPGRALQGAASLGKLWRSQLSAAPGLKDLQQWLRALRALLSRREPAEPTARAPSLRPREVATSQSHSQRKCRDSSCEGCSGAAAAGQELPVPRKERAPAHRWASAAPCHEPCPARTPAAAPRVGAGLRRQLEPAPEVLIKRTKALLVLAPHSRCGQLVPARSRLTQSWRFGNSFQTRWDVGVSVRPFALRGDARGGTCRAATTCCNSGG